MADSSTYVKEFKDNIFAYIEDYKLTQVSTFLKLAGPFVSDVNYIKSLGKFLWTHKSLIVETKEIKVAGFIEKDYKDEIQKIAKDTHLGVTMATSIVEHIKGSISTMIVGGSSDKLEELRKRLLLLLNLYIKWQLNEIAKE
jgi:hypothetical protein